MPRLSIIQTNFTTGEISPRIVARTDIDKYPGAARKLVNAHPFVHGGAGRRAGTLYSGHQKVEASAARVIEFVVSKDIAYSLEFGEGYVRVRRPSGPNPIWDFVSPYTAQQAQELDFTQGADSMFIWHGQVFPQRLRHFSDTNWDLSSAPFTVQPFDELGTSPAADLTFSATAPGAATVTASGGVFLPSDVGRNIDVGTGIAKVITFTDTTHLGLTIVSALPGLLAPNGTWSFDLSPQGFAKPQLTDVDAGVSGAVINVTGAIGRNATLTLSNTTGSITITASAPIFSAGDTGLHLFADSGEAALTFVDSTHLTGVTASDFLTTSYPVGSWGITGGVFRASDVGSYMRINGGLAKIAAFSSASSVSAQIITALTSNVAAPPLSWSLESNVWSFANGYPRTGTLFEQRLWCAGSKRFPQTIWGSRTALYYDFTKGSADSDACIFTIASDEINPITYLSSARMILIQTYGGELSMRGGVEKPITPSNVQIKPETTYGSKTVRPVTVGKDCLFVQRAGRKLRAMAYQIAVDGYDSPDLTILAEHITLSGIVAMAWQQEPDQLLWAVLGDGSMITCTLDRSQNVAAWAHHYTDGAFESVCAVPTGTFDQIWVTVRRTINGATARYVEYFDHTFAPMLPVAADPNALPPIAQPVIYGTTVDSGVSFDALTPDGLTVFAVPYLAGKMCDIVADGAPQPQQMPDVFGNITIARPAQRVLIGLPFKSEIGLLTPEVGTGTGTAQGNSMRTGEITMRFLNTVGATVLDGEGRNQDVPWRYLRAAVLDKAPETFTGEMRVEMLGWERGRSELSIVQDQPLPLQLLSVVRKFTVND